MRRIKVGIIGCGVIGSEIAKACVNRFGKKMDLVAVSDIDGKKAAALKKVVKKSLAILPAEALIKRVDLVIEAASAKISPDIVRLAVKYDRDLLVMSVGGLLGREALMRSVLKSSIKLYLPSGAICGIDGVKASRIGNITSATLTTRKPPKGLAGAPYIVKRNIDLSAIKGETVIFDGTALQAVAAFPQNINVAAVLSIAGVGGSKTRVRIVTSPEYDKNVHEVEITGESGKIFTRTENVPSKINPKTSALAFYSAIAALENIVSNIKIGT